jgi:hypothetical protein
VLGRRIVRRGRDRLAQQRLGFAVAPGGAIEIGEIDYTGADVGSRRSAWR